MSEETRPGLRMHEFDDAEAGILAYEILAGTMTAEDAAPIWARFDDAKAAGQGIRIYSEISGFPSTSGGMVLDKLKRLGTIFSVMERMAIVGDAGWMEVYAKVVDPITKFDVRHFTTAARDEALAWLRE